jgi:hypothetical protein
MKHLRLYILCIIFLSCNQQKTDNILLESKIDSLQSRLDKTYKPGFGEFMSSVQVHHNKLWFAGQYQNWKLADFEIHEIMESVEDIKQYQTEREESKKIDIIIPALDSVMQAIDQKNITRFNSSYILLTNTCNSCHRSTKFEFNVVKVPDNPPFSNQSFTPLQ